MIWEKITRDYSEDIRIIKNENELLMNRANSKVRLHKNNEILWINNPNNKSGIDFINSALGDHLHDKRIFISRCDTELVNYYKNNGFETLKFGKEAVLDLGKDHFMKKSLRELIKKGSKAGETIELINTKENIEKLENFKNECVHESEPQLKYVFNDVFLPSSRLFVFLGHDNLWLGAITITNSVNNKMTTDLMLRRKNAPKGVMEGLIFNIFNTLKIEGYDYWSLGEVPFIVYDSPILTKEFLLNFSGRKLSFAYNYLGLYNFKNKFNPIWEETYLCGKPNLNLSSLLFIAILSNLVNLVISKLGF